MAQAQQKVEYGQIIPAFTLPGTDGMTHSPWNYKQREHLLLLFFDSSTTANNQTMLRVCQQRYSDLREEYCALLAISADPVITNLHIQETLHLPFPLLADPQGTVIARYTDWHPETRTFTPLIVLADRYGALYQQWYATDEAEWPPMSDIMESLQYINKLCTP